MRCCKKSVSSTIFDIELAHLNQFFPVGKIFFENCGRYTFLRHLIFLLTDRILSPSTDFGRPKHGKKTFGPPLSSRYSERWVRNDSDDLCSQKFSVTECFTKIRVFLHFSVSACKKKVYHTANSILMPPTFHIASLNNYTPKFSAYKQPSSWPVANSLAYSSSQRV